MYIQIRHSLTFRTELQCAVTIYFFISVGGSLGLMGEKMNYLAPTPMKPSRVESPSLVFCTFWCCSLLPSFSLSEKFLNALRVRSSAACVSARRLELSKRVIRGRRRPAALTAVGSRLSAAEEKMTKLSRVRLCMGSAAPVISHLGSGGGRGWPTSSRD